MADLLDLMAAIFIGPECDLPGLPGTLVGSGPYRIVPQTDSRVVLAAHDRYWGPAPRYPEIRFVAEPDARKRVDALLAGEADVATGIGIEGKRRLAAAGDRAAYSQMVRDKKINDARASDDHGMDTSPGRPAAAAMTEGAERRATRGSHRSAWRLDYDRSDWLTCLPCPPDEGRSR